MEEGANTTAANVDVAGVGRGTMVAEGGAVQSQSPRMVDIGMRLS